MAAIKSEMPPLHAAETTAASLSSIGSGGVSGSGGGGGGSGVGGGTNGTTVTTNATTTSSTSGGSVGSAVNNTISAAADSSDNQPGTPQPQTQQIGVNDQQQQHHQTSSSSTAVTHHAFGGHNIYPTASTTTSSGGALTHMYGSGIYATTAAGNNNGGSGGGGAHDLQHQQQQQQQHYPSYLNSYEQFYQQQGQTQSSTMQGGGSGLDYSNAGTLYGSSNSSDYKSSSASAGVRYHPYLQTPTSNGAGNSGTNANDGHDGTSASLSGNNASSGAVSTTTSMSPRVVSSSSPTSTSSQLHMGSGNNTGGSGGGNPQSPACNQQLLCKKCGIMCTNETELQEHITNVHGASPYGSSGYSSSPYIKEELTGAPPTQQQQQQQSGGNPGELLDLDSQKMVYPPIPGSMQSLMGGHSGLHHQQHHHGMHEPIVSDPLHSMHTMQQRALPGWDQTPVIGGQEGLPAYMQQTDITGGVKPNQSPYYSPKQSPYASGGTNIASIKQEYPLIKSEYADSQNYVDKSFDPSVTSAPDMCQQQQQSATVQQSMLPVSSSPAEFPSTTTGPTQDQQQYRSFEPPTSSSVLPANSITAKAATWKSNEARRPKTYNCTACNKWFTSSGHLKRHYNTTLHKNAVKTSGQPDPATLPISAHHHPARDPSGKHSRRGGGNNSAAAAAAAAAAQQQKPPAPVQPPEPPRTPPDYVTQTGVVGSGSGGTSLGPMSHYSTSPSPTSVGLPYGQQNGYQQTQPQPYISQVQSTTNASPQHVSNVAGATQSQAQSQQHQSGTILNGHPNGLAGPSALTTTTTAATPTLLMPSSHTRGLLNTTTTTITTIKREISAEEDIINNTANTRSTNINSPMDMGMMDKEMLSVAGARVSRVSDETAETLPVTLGVLQQHHPLLVKQELSDLDPGYQQILDQEQHQQQQQLRRYRNNTPNSRAQSPLIISQQQYQEQLHLQQQMEQADSIFSQQQQQAHMLPPLQLQLQANTMEGYNIMPLDINMQQQHSSSMQLLQPSQRITNTHMVTTANMLDSIPMQQQPQQQHNLLRHLQEQQEREGAEQEHNTLSSTTTITNMQDTQQRISTTITPQPPHMLTPLPQLQPSITNPIIPSFQQLLPQEAPLQLEHTMTYHTIIGSNNQGGNNNANGSDCDGPTSTDLLQLGSYDPYGNSSMFTTTDGQILQFIPNGNSGGSLSLMHPTYFTSYPTRTAAVAESYVRAYSSSTTQRSPQEADVPPASTLTHAFARSPQESQTTLNMASEMPFSPTVSSSTTPADTKNGILDDYTTTMDYTKQTISNDSNNAKQPEKSATKRAKRGSPMRNPNPPKRKRVATGDAGISTTTTSAVVLPSGRIKCVDCNKEFTKICYLTQHNKCFHSGEYPYRCEKCGKRFQSEDVYTTHLGRHKTQDKPHKCQLCPKQFHHKTDLRRHIEAIHTGLKQHTCDICEKSFCRKDHLRKHLETHSRLRVVSARKGTSKSTTVRRGKADEKVTDDSMKAIKSEVYEIRNEPGGGPSSSSPPDETEPGIAGDHAALDVLVVIKNEADLSVLHEGDTNGLNMNAIHDDLAPDDESLLDDDDEDDEDAQVELMMSHVTQMQQQEEKSLHNQQQQSTVVYVNGGIPT